MISPLKQAEPSGTTGAAKKSLFHDPPKLVGDGSSTDTVMTFPGESLMEWEKDGIV